MLLQVGEALYGVDSKGRICIGRRPRIVMESTEVEHHKIHVAREEFTACGIGRTVADRFGKTATDVAHDMHDTQ